jgi:hypothetical protein
VDAHGRHRCPICNRECASDIYRRDHDDHGDYEYYWGPVRVPRWLAEILEVPWRQQVDILLFGFLVGLIVAAVALVWGLMLAPS